MQSIKLPAAEIPVAARCEVLVAGGGPAGYGAALAAARAGRDTLLLEQSGLIGGIATSGIMSHWTGRQGGGFLQELLAQARDGESPEVINPEKLKLVMLENLIEAGVRVQFQTFISGTLTEGGRVTGVVTESKSGREAVLADITVDCTGDGDVACRAGAAYEQGRREDGGMQPVTIMFKVAGVDYDRAMIFWGMEDSEQLPEGDLQALGHKELPGDAGHVLLYPSSLPGVVTVNMTNTIGIDGTDVRQLSRAEYACRKQIGPITEFLRRYVPGYECCYPIDSANAVGVRETRRFCGLYQLTEQDISEARVFDDWVVTKSHFFFDLHNVDGAGLDAKAQYKSFKQENDFTIPYRCFVPQAVDGLLLCGRNISGTHLAHSSYRIMPICVNMGQAAGNAAALCVAQGVQPRALDVRDIQDVLTTQNVTL